MNVQNLWDRYYTQDHYEVIRRSYMRDIYNRTNGETNLYAMRQEILKLQTQLGNSFLPMLKMSMEVREYDERAVAKFRVCCKIYLPNFVFAEFCPRLASLKKHNYLYVYLYV